MRYTSRLLSLALFLCAAVATAQTMINPATQITWPKVTGAGVPSAGACTTNYGQPYTDVTASAEHYYVCTPDGWFQTDGGSVLYPTGTGIPQVAGGAAWGTTLTPTTFGGFFAGLLNCATPGYSYVPADNQCEAAGAGNVVGPASSTTNEVAFFSDATGKLIGGDPNIVIDPVTHAVKVGGTPTFSVAIGPLSPMSASWNWDTTTPLTALQSLGGIVPGGATTTNSLATYLDTTGKNLTSSSLTSTGVILGNTVNSGTINFNVGGNMALNGVGAIRFQISSTGVGRVGATGICMGFDCAPATNMVYQGQNSSTITWQVDKWGTTHLTAPNLPTVSTGTIDTNATNVAGSITGISAATSVTITFSTNGAYSTWASCTANTDSTSIFPANTAQTNLAVTFSFASAFTGKLYYHCAGK